MTARIVPISTENGTQYMVVVNGHTVFETKKGLMSEAIAYCFACGVRVVE